MVKSHNDRIKKNGEDKGYSIRVGNKVPKNSANLAYVYSEQISPEKNIEINDMTKFIPENKVSEVEKELKILFPTEDFLLREMNSETNLSSKDFIIGDEFSVPSSRQEESVPLFYETDLEGFFNPKNSLVSPYVSGYTESPAEAVPFVKINNNERDTLLYLGNKIVIERKDGVSLEEGDKYKIKLTKVDGYDEPIYSIKIFSNFKCSKDITYFVEYSEYLKEGKTSFNKVEVLNANTYFSEIDKFYIDELVDKQEQWQDVFNYKNYAVVESPTYGYNIYVPSQMIVANNITRPANQFKYRVVGELETKLSETNKGTLNLGIHYINNAGPTYQNLTSALKKLNEDNLKPEYLDFVNPNPPLLSYTKDNPNYWTVDISMPLEKLDKYDLIIISGYGFKDMSMYNDNLRDYLNNGGKILIDNAGSGQNVLSFTKSSGEETFLSTVSFSKEETTSTYRKIGESESALELNNRIYKISNENNTFGYNTNQEAVNPKMVFGALETNSIWENIVETELKEPLVMKRKVFENGELIFSSIGLLRGLYYENVINTKLLMNMLLFFSERKYFIGQWKQEYVHHRKNLFRDEYKDYNGKVVYVDDKSDTDNSLVVAKKIIEPSVRDSLIPYLPKEFKKAEGLYRVETKTNNQINIENYSFENRNEEEIKWTTSNENAINGWNTVHAAGSTPVFKHEVNDSARGSYSISIETGMDSLGSNAYWTSKYISLNKGVYKLSSFVKIINVSKVSGKGLQLCLLDSKNNLVYEGRENEGNTDWFELSELLEIEENGLYKIAIGFVSGNSNGRVLIDNIEVNDSGNVLMTPENKGQLPLYAYASRPKAEIFNMKSKGFDDSDITIYDPEIKFNYTIKSYVYRWSNELSKYMKVQGNSVTNELKVKRSDGIKNIGEIIQTLLPPSLSGNEWSDPNNIYYEIEVGNSNEESSDMKFINLQIYDSDKGVYYYSKDGRLVIRYLDIYYEKRNANIFLQAYTDYYTVRGVKRRYGVMMKENSTIELKLPKTIDNKDNWHVQVKNGSFLKDELTYIDLLGLETDLSVLSKYTNRVFGQHFYALPEYSRQLFNPSIGIKSVVNETVQYVDDSTLKLQNNPLYYKKGTVEKEQLKMSGETGLIYKGENNKWSKKDRLAVYNDKDEDNKLVRLTSGFDIDYDNGSIIFHAEIGDNPNLLSNTDFQKTTDVEHVWDSKLNRFSKVADDWVYEDYLTEDGENEKGSHAYVNYDKFTNEPVLSLSSSNKSLGIDRELKIIKSVDVPLEKDVEYTISYQIFSSDLDKSVQFSIGNTNISSTKILDVNKWERKNEKIILPNDINAANFKISVKDNIDGEFYIKNIMLSKSKTNGRWLPSIKDMNGSAIPKGKVYLDYSMNNLSLYERVYNNKTIKEEELFTSDFKTYYSNNTHWLKFPNPTIYTSYYGTNKKEVANPKSYKVDYENGTIEFKEETRIKVYASYQHTIDKEVDIEYVDIENGIIKASKNVDFRKEYYANYSYREEYVEYKGYYDESLNKFMYLDLNPLEGHYSTLPIVTTNVLGEEKTKFIESPSNKLINKEIYLYIVPYKNSFGQFEPNTLRHCFSKEEWEITKNTNPTALLLGIITVRENTSKEDVVIMDTRKYGGGIRKDISDNKIKEKDIDAMTFWDIGSWEGEAYYKNGVLIFEIPKKVLIEHGGKLTNEQVIEKINKYVAFGIYSIIEYVD